MKRHVAARVLEAGGLGPVLRHACSWRGLLVLNYHRLAPSADGVLDQGVWSATAADFDAQLAFLAREFDILPAGQLDFASLQRTGRYLLITFDDGYRDAYHLAYPALRRHGLSAVFFVVTGLIDAPQLMWWDSVAWLLRSTHHSVLPPGSGLPELSLAPDDREESTAIVLRHCLHLSADDRASYLAEIGQRLAVGGLPDQVARDLWMTWDMVREMHAAGMAFGGHTHSHAALGHLPLDQQRTEIETCCHRLETELGTPTRLFSYPFGHRAAFTHRTMRALRDAGVELAFSQYGGFQNLRDLRPLDIRRAAVERWHDPAAFRALVTWPRVFAPLVHSAPGVTARRTHRGELTIERISHPACWAAMADEWRRLFECSPTATAALRWEWLSEWWRVYGPAYAGGPDALRVLAVRRGDELIGAVALYLTKPRGALKRVQLRLVSSGEAIDEETCADYLDLLYRPGEREAVTQALADSLLREIGGYDEVVFEALTPNAALLALLQPFRRAGWRVSKEVRQQSHQVDLSDGWDGFLARHSRRGRARLRHIISEAASLNVLFEIACEPPAVERCFHDLVELHQRRWTALGHAGCFSAARFTEFHQRLVKRLIPWTELVLARLSVGDKPLAVLYGFRVADRMELYQLGVDTTAQEVAGPGTMSHVLLMERLAADGVQCFDMLRGHSSIKERYATAATDLVWMRARRPGLKSLLATCGDGIRQVARRLRGTATATATATTTATDEPSTDNE